MSEPGASVASVTESRAPVGRLGRVAMAVLWPSFLMAGVLTSLVFALVDPGDLTWLGGAPLEWPRQALYTGGFLLFWLVISLAASLSVLMAALPDTPELPAEPNSRGWPR